MRRTSSALAAFLALASAGQSSAASHEIQVHTDDIAKPGEHGLELHTNVSRPGSATDEPQRRTWRAMPEYSYGFARNWELSLGLPITRLGNDLNGNGARAEVQYVAPHDEERGFYWGLNTEVAYSRNLPDQSLWAMELTPILGVRIGKWHLAVNPVLERSLSGAERHTTFEPAAKAALKIHTRHEIGLEYYAELGRLKNFLPSREQSHTLFGVWGYEGRMLELNVGIGRGLTNASDRWVAKLIIELKPD